MRVSVVAVDVVDVVVAVAVAVAADVAFDCGGYYYIRLLLNQQQ